MTVHTGLGWRDPGKRKLLDGGVTVAAVDSVIADVVFMAELNRLLSGKEGLGVVRGAVELEQHPDGYAKEKNRAEDSDLRDEVGASIKDLSHRFPNSRQELETECSNGEPRIEHKDCCADFFQSGIAGRVGPAVRRGTDTGRELSPGLIHDCPAARAPTASARTF